jgi:hypothetical protein
MHPKVAVSLILFLFPALIAPLIILALLTKLPDPLGSLFLNYSFAWLWGCYLLLAAGAAFAYFKFKRHLALQETAQQGDDKAPADDTQQMIIESPQG